MRIASFFSGFGGLDLGAELAGGEVIYAADVNPAAVRVYSRNLRRPAVCADIRATDPASIPDADAYCAGFPCQPFSVSGKRGGLRDPRGTLFFDLLKIISARLPRAVLLENVGGLKESRDGAFDKVLTALEALGYSVDYKTLCAEDYGVPQRRFRVFIVAFRDFADRLRFDWPAPLPAEAKIGWRDVIDPDDPGDYVRPCNMAILPPALEPRSMYKINTRRLHRWPFLGSPTITTAIRPGGLSACIVTNSSSQPRGLSVAEALTLQSFPPGFDLAGVAHASAWQGIANAVPPTLGAAVFRSLFSALF